MDQEADVSSMDRQFVVVAPEVNDEDSSNQFVLYTPQVEQDEPTNQFVPVTPNEQDELSVDITPRPNSPTPSACQIPPWSNLASCSFASAPQPARPTRLPRPSMSNRHTNCSPEAGSILLTCCLSVRINTSTDTPSSPPYPPRPFPPPSLFITRSARVSVRASHIPAARPRPRTTGTVWETRITHTTFVTCGCMIRVAWTIWCRKRSGSVFSPPFPGRTRC